MIFNKLVTTPTRWPGGVSFTLDDQNGGHAIFVSNSTITTQAPGCHSDAERLRWVMIHVADLVRAAEEKAPGSDGSSQLVVLGPNDM